MNQLLFCEPHEEKILTVKCMCVHMSTGPQLKIVSTMSVGYDHVDTSEIKQRSVFQGWES